MTLGAVNALHSLGLQHEVAMVGFDDVDLADVIDPSITVIPQQPEELGRRAAEILFERINGSDDPPFRDIVARAIVERGSGEIPAL